MLEFINWVLGWYQVVPCILFLILSAVSISFWKDLLKGNITVVTIAGMLMFFLGIDIAFNIGWVLITDSLSPAQTVVGGLFGWSQLVV